MISSVSGKRTAVGLDWVVIDVGGIGIQVQVPSSTASEMLAEKSDGIVILHTQLIVREDSLTLFGFLTESERDTFNILLSISGIGPRTALGALGILSPGELRAATESEDLKTLQKIPGVGKKSAQRMLLELAGKLPQDLSNSQPVGAQADQTVEQVKDALQQLGWTKTQVDASLNGMDTSGKDSATLLQETLRNLGRAGQ